MRTFSALTLLLLLAVASCSSPTPSEEPVIDLLSSTCYGPCPSYQIVVHPNGFVHFKPFENTAVSNVMTRKVDTRVVAQLLQEAKAVSFFDREASYIYDTIPGIGAVTHSDGQGVTLRITHEGKTKSVYMYLGVPQELIDLKKHIVEATIPSSWIE